MKKKRFRKERPPKMLRFFFWDGKLHRTLFIDRPRNTIIAFCYDDKKKVQFVYSHIRVHRERAWRTSEVAKLMNRSRVTVQRYISEGLVSRPAMTYSMDDDEKYKGIGFWTAKQIFDLHDMLLEPAPPGKRSRASHNVPSRMELVAKMEEGVSYVVEDSEGNRTRAFKETMW